MRLTAYTVAACLALLLAEHAAQAGPYQFNGQGEYQNDGPYYYVITGNSAKLPASQLRNGDNGSGGTMRFILDDPGWPGGRPLGQWQKDDWFPQTAGLALTLKNNGTAVYDNNGIDDGSYGNFYSAQGSTNAATPGLYRGYSMVNNWDWMYASYFELEVETTFDSIVGYFDLTNDNGLDDFLSNHSILMSIWSETGDLLPANTGSFIGDVFSTATSAGTFSITDPLVNRVFDDNTTDKIYRVEYRLNDPLKLGPGGYYFSNAAAVAPEPSSMALLGSGVLGLAGFYRRRRRSAV